MFYFAIQDLKRQSSVVRTFQLQRGDVIRLAVRMGGYGSQQYTTPPGYQNCDLNLVKLD